MFSGAGEVGINLDAVADIDDDQKRRPFGQGFRVLLGLAASAQHRRIPGLGSADAVSTPAARLGEAGLLREASLPRFASQPLLCLQYEGSCDDISR